MPPDHAPVPLLSVAVPPTVTSGLNTSDGTAVGSIASPNTTVTVKLSAPALESAISVGVVGGVVAAVTDVTHGSVASKVNVATAVLSTFPAVSVACARTV